MERTAPKWAYGREGGLNQMPLLIRLPINPFDMKKMVAKTGAMKGTVGDLWNVSKEASEKRSEKLGHEDPVKRKYLDNYAKEHQTRHYYDKPSRIENKHAIVDFTAKSDGD